MAAGALPDTQMVTLVVGTMYRPGCFAIVTISDLVDLVAEV